MRSGESSDRVAGATQDLALSGLAVAEEILPALHFFLHRQARRIVVEEGGRRVCKRRVEGLQRGDSADLVAPLAGFVAGPVRLEHVQVGFCLA